MEVVGSVESLWRYPVKSMAGEQVTVTVAGRPAARLVPVAPRAWRSWEETAELFAGPTDHDWDRDRDLIGQQLEDPWPAA